MEKLLNAEHAERKSAEAAEFARRGESKQI